MCNEKEKENITFINELKNISFVKIEYPFNFLLLFFLSCNSKYTYRPPSEDL